MDVIIPIWLFWTLLVFILVVMAIAGYFVYMYLKIKRSDKLIFFDNNMRWRLVDANYKGLDKFELGNKTYFLTENLGFLNNKGKALYIFHENNSQPMAIQKHKGEWLNPESLKGIINNKLVQMMLKPADQFKDQLLLFGALGGIVAGLASVFVLLNQLGIINIG